MKIKWLGIALLVPGIWTAQANLVINPGFETGNFSGWTLSGNLGYIGITSYAPDVHSGNYAASFGAVGSQTILAQTAVATVAGQNYDLSFWLKNNYGGPTTEFTVWWNGTQIYDLHNAPAFGWTELTFSGLSASGSSSVLQFGFRQDPSFWKFDDVQVTGVVPEPSTMLAGALLMLPFGVGVVRHLRKKS